MREDTRARREHERSSSRLTFRPLQFDLFLIRVSLENCPSIIEIASPLHRKSESRDALSLRFLVEQSTRSVHRGNYRARLYRALISDVTFPSTPRNLPFPRAPPSARFFRDRRRSAACRDLVFPLRKGLQHLVSRASVSHSSSFSRGDLATDRSSVQICERSDEGAGETGPEASGKPRLFARV